MKSLVAMILLAFPLLVLAQETAEEEESRFPQQLSASDLQRTCAASALSDVGRQRRRFCTGFISGVEEGVRILQLQHKMEPSICLPQRVSSRALNDVFLKYTANRQALLTRPAAEVVLEAFARAYPCREE